MKKSGILLVAVAAFAGVFGALQIDRRLHPQESQPLIVRGSGSPLAIPAAETGTVAAPVDFREAARKVNPSVVSVDQFIRTSRFMDEQPALQEAGSGSGVIISSNGIVVTNNHVVLDPRDRSRQTVAEEIRVRLTDNRSYKARVLGCDPRADLAVPKIDAKDLVPVELGDSGRVEVGQWVVAVGNPLGFSNTVSVGVVSSLGRSIDIDDVYLIDNIQTDAAINPGNSGGALCDAQGRLIGIDSAIASRTGMSIGIGFAIPINRVRRIVDDIVEVGYARYAGLGIQYNPRSAGFLQFPQGRAQLAEIAGAEPPSYGIIVGGVEPTSAASRAGIAQFDVLLSIDGKKLDDAIALDQVLVNKRPGDKVALRYWSRGTTKDATIALQEIRSQ